ncbi:glutaredoxin family protein [Flavicella sediminum]|uniref:glutaredoxin family protein n=1 Tax=Flavicella sediminum TaxID=2585141 RepID=UPI00111F537A|nr:glutaredoxin domain-containing protein [Flavicella sediminum]
MRALIFSVLLVLAFTNISYGQVASSTSLTEKKETKKMIVYGSDTCHYCLDAKAYLKERKIDFIYYDVDLNLVKQREMLVKLQKAGISVDNLSLPVVDLQGKMLMNGANFEAFLKKLN